MHGPITHARNIDSVLNDISRYLRDLLVCDTCKFWWCLICVFATRAKKKILARTLLSLRPFVHWLLSTASPVCQQRETGRFWVQDLGSGHVERTLRTRRMRSSPYVAGRHCNRKLPTDACWRTLRTRGMHSSSCVAGRHSLDNVH